MAAKQKIHVKHPVAGTYCGRRGYIIAADKRDEVKDMLCSVCKHRANQDLGFKVGDRVRFRGTANPDNPADFTSVCVDGPDTFEATITEDIGGICWGLRWDDGSPLGIPFHDHMLTKVEK